MIKSVTESSQQPQGRSIDQSEVNLPSDSHQKESSNNYLDSDFEDDTEDQHEPEPPRR